MPVSRILIYISQKNYLEKCLFGVWIHNLMPLPCWIWTVATSDAASSKSDVRGTTSVFDSTSFCRTGIFCRLLFGGYPRLFTQFHHNKTHVIIWILQIKPPTHLSNEILTHTYIRIQTGCNLRLQHLQTLILLRVVYGHLVVHKSRHELCRCVKMEFSENRVVSWNNLNHPLLDVCLPISKVLDFGVHESSEWSLTLIAIKACPWSTLLLLLLYTHPSW